jgi:hypothetical protein
MLAAFLLTFFNIQNSILNPELTYNACQQWRVKRVQPACWRIGWLCYALIATITAITVKASPKTES